MTSEQLFAEASKVIPGGVNSPVRAFKHVGRSPIYFDQGQGAYLTDVEGHTYIDFCLSFGPHLLGHSPKAVVDAVKAQADRGFSYGACHHQEITFAKLLLRAYPHLQRVRSLTSGTEAVMTAIRLARGFTGRPKILKFEGCFHGHSDSLLVKSGSGVAELAEASSGGVSEAQVSDTLVCRYDSIDEIRTVFGKYGSLIAAVIMEPIPANYGLWIPKYEPIREICDLAKKHGTLVIFDEVITGFRLGIGGATAFYDLRPDLVTLGKVIGGGLPLAAVVGRAEIMDRLAPLGEVYQAGTMAGNAMAVAAGCAVLEALFERRPQMKAFDDRCEKFAQDLEKILKTKYEVQVSALGSIFWIHFGPETKTFPPEISADGAKTYATFFKHCLKQGIYLAPSPYEVGFLSYAHSPEVLDESLKRFERALEPG